MKWFNKIFKRKYKVKAKDIEQHTIRLSVDPDFKISASFAFSEETDWGFPTYWPKSMGDELMKDDVLLEAKRILDDTGGAG